MRNDAEIIEEGRQLATVNERSAWRLGELALEFAPVGDPARKTGVYARIREFAEAIGAADGTIRNYRQVVASWQGIDVEGFVFGTLDDLVSVTDKAGLIAALRDTEPPTKSGRWTGPAAVEFAKENGFWSHAAGAQARDVMSVLERTRRNLTRLTDVDLTYDDATAALALLTEVRFQIEALQRVLSGKTAKREAELSGAA